MLLSPVGSRKGIVRMAFDEDIMKGNLFVICSQLLMKMLAVRNFFSANGETEN